MCHLQCEEFRRQNQPRVNLASDEKECTPVYFVMVVMWASDSNSVVGLPVAVKKLENETEGFK